MWVGQPTMFNKNTCKFNLFEDKKPLSYEKVVHYWQDNFEFRVFYFSILEDAPFEAFFWENPPITKLNSQQAYEFVLVNSPQLSGIVANSRTFQAQWTAATAGQTVVAFENLSGDAELIAPCPLVSHAIYAHFATFIRQAPEDQKHDLFMLLAASLRHSIRNQPLWVSTSGLGVYWLHIRLDTRPKYYTYQAYRRWENK